VHSEGFAFAYVSQERPAQCAGLCRRTAGWGRAAKLGIDDSQYATEIAVDLIVPGPQDAKSVARQRAIAYAIFVSMLIEIVLPSIEFYDELLFHADEIDDVPGAR
jgi:hypothetical protein